MTRSIPQPGREGDFPKLKAVSRKLLGLALLLALLAGCDEKPAAEKLDGREGRDLALDQFRPAPQLKAENHQPQRAKFPVVDIHVHPRIRIHQSPELLADFVKLMDNQNIAMCVSLDGGLGEKFAEHKAYLWDKYPNRFAIFANVDWKGQGADKDWASWDCQRPDFGRRMTEALKAAHEQGASGLKVFKDFGLVYRNPDSSFIALDDPRWDDIWRTCGELGMPVIIHVTDPPAFFEAIDEHNERWEELRRHPEWSFHGPSHPKREDVLNAFLHIVERHPKTTFIGAHLVNIGDDLTRLSGWLDKHPNLVVEITSRINELGRQPYTARKFLIQYADRVMFGTDGPRPRERLLPHWRFFETMDEYFPYAENPFPPQGFWNIYGVGLPDDVLRKIYYENAARIIPGVKERLKAQEKGS